MDDSKPSTKPLVKSFGKSTSGQPSQAFQLLTQSMGRNTLWSVLERRAQRHFLADWRQKSAQVLETHYSCLLYRI